MHGARLGLWHVVLSGWRTECRKMMMMMQLWKLQYKKDLGSLCLGLPLRMFSFAPVLEGSYRFIFSTFTFELSYLWPWPFACVWIIALLRLKVRGQRLKHVWWDLSWGQFSSCIIQGVLKKLSIPVTLK